MKAGPFEVEPQKERSLVKMPDNFDYADMCDQSQRLASNYCVIFVLDGQVLGSGTLVTVNAIHGILTAHHVLRVPYSRKEKEFSFCSHNVIHRLDASASDFEHIILGDSARNKFEHSGPDLSFLMITNPKLLSTLNAKKSFYPLVKDFDVHEYPDEKLRQMVWTASGSPKEFAQDLGIHKGEQLWKFSDFHMPIYFHSLKKRNGFDYFRFQVHSGVEDFPSKFGGVSGGGIWLPSMQEMKNGKIEYPPMLQGVIFYESRPYKNDTRRLLIGHGPDSIYNCVAQALR